MLVMIMMPLEKGNMKGIKQFLVELYDFSVAHIKDKKNKIRIHRRR